MKVNRILRISNKHIETKIKNTLSFTIESKKSNKTHKRSVILKIKNPQGKKAKKI